MKFNIKIAFIVAAFTMSMLFIITVILLYKGHEHLMMLNITNSQEVIHHFDLALRETALWSIALLLIVIMISSLLIARILTKPIHEMNKFALSLVKGKRNLKINYTIDDQIGQLGQSLLKLDQTLTVYERRRKEMTQELAHEIRNPLASVKSYLSAFQDGILNPTTKNLQACTEEMDRLITLIGELDTLNDINHPTFKISKNDCNIAKLIEKAVTGVASELLEKEIHLKLEVDETIYAEVDELRINQVLHNIIKNAMYHVSKEGTIKITLFREETHFCILIYDNGVGMDLETRNRIFEWNYREKNAYEGRGIGMTITKKLVEAHGGEITVKSNLNEGTTFHIQIPFST